ncbi:MAG TPA: glutamate--tRNA ligase [bacterium]|nr:glutamate--tRNA ligase [bacterium]
MVKVRFAPSPTGFLHIGGARTALFNYVFAKHNRGKFVLRIEDTDKERSTKESEEEILDSLRWLGLDWDEGPRKSADDSMYYQTNRLDVYKKHADRLLAEGKAYRCFCSKEELDLLRREAEAQKRAFKYDGRCAAIPENEAKKRLAENTPYTVRIKVPRDGDTVIEDLVRGRVKTANSVLDDMIIVRADGMPVYNFVVVVDDADMEITHVIRGEDHLSNTSKQVHIYNALGFTPPKFAHIPLILGPDRSKLSKRHGETAVVKYRESGFLPEALVNYMALLGWSPDDEETVFSMEEMTEKFSIERVHKAGAMFDNQKLLWMNGVYIREKKSVKELAALCMPFFEAAGLKNPRSAEYFEKVVALQQEKLKTLAEFPGLSAYFFNEDAPLSEDAKKTWEKNAENRKQVIEVFVNIMKTRGASSAAQIEADIKADMESAGIKPKVYMHVIRVAVSGSTIGPGLFELVETLGAEICVKRAEKLISNG